MPLATHHGVTLKALQPIDYRESWEFLSRSIRNILFDPLRYQTPSDWEPIMSRVYRFCTWNCANVPGPAAAFGTDQLSAPHVLLIERDPQPAFLYFNTESLVNEHLRLHVREVLTGVYRDAGPQAMLIEYSKAWMSFSVAATTLSVLLFYLEKDWIRRTKQLLREGKFGENAASIVRVSKIKTMCLTVWRHAILDHLTPLLNEAVVDLYETRYTHSSTSSRADLAESSESAEAPFTAIAMYVSSLLTIYAESSKPLSLYQSMLESVLIDSIQKQSDSFARSFLVEHSMRDLLSALQDRILVDQKFVSRYLHACSERPLLKALADAVLGSRMRQFLDECEVCLHSFDVQGSRRLYNLLLATDDTLLVHYRKLVEDHVAKTGLAKLQRVCTEVSESRKGRRNFSIDGDVSKPLLSDEGSTPDLLSASASASASLGSTSLAGQPQHTAGAKVVMNIGGQDVIVDFKLDPTPVVKALYETYHRFADFACAAFAGDVGFESSVETGMTQVLGATFAQVPIVLARFSDHLLRRSHREMRSLPESEIEDNISCIVALYRLLPQRDVFDAFFQEYLGRRLIQGLVELDYEELMIAKLKPESRFEYIHKLSRMFQDVRVSDDLSRMFCSVDEGLRLRSLYDFDFKAMVLTAGAWQLNSTVPGFLAPTELANFILAFDVFYRAQHSGRKLTWLHHTSNGVMRTMFPLLGHHSFPHYEFQVTTFQMSILILFNKHNWLTVAEMSRILGVDDAVARMHMKTLIRAGIVAKRSDLEGLQGSRDDDGNDDGKLPSNQSHHNANSESLEQLCAYGVNMFFRSSKRRLQIHQYALRESHKEIAHTFESIAEDRKALIQASIVRVMKTRRKCTHSELVSEVLSLLQSRFVPQLHDIKENIGVLLERDYIERVDDNSYRYIS
eukprot:ANDGO_03183.mRNA.1 Cullin-1